MMGQTDEHDQALLDAFTNGGEERAFDALVRRHVDLVYSAARRQIGRGELAEDVTQAVFILLWRKAPSIRGKSLGAWLVQTTRYVAMAAARRETSLKRREAKAAAMRPEVIATDDPQTTAAWAQVAPLLDAAIGRLAEADRAVVTLRFLQGLSFASVAAALGVSEAAATKRAARALARLRLELVRRGVSVSAAAISGEMIARFGTVAAPAHLAGAAVSGAKASALAATASTGAAIARSASQLMLFSKVKAAAVVVVASAVAIAAAGASVAHFAGGRGGGPSDIQLDDVVFEPVGQGKSIAHVKLKAPQSATTRQSVAIILQSRSSDGRGAWKGYMFFGGALPGGASDVRVPFQIPEPFGRSASVTVNLYRDDQPTADIWKSGRTPPTLFSRQFPVAKLPARTIAWDALPRASDSQTAEARQLLSQVQERLHLGLYGRASELFSIDWAAAENAPIRDWFRKRIYPAEPEKFTWDAARIQQFEAGECLVNGDALLLLVKFKNETRAVELVRDKGKLKVDWIYPGIRGVRATTSPPATQEGGGT